MTLWRILPHDPQAGEIEPGGALWFPRGLQGTGRHDNRDRYGCLYLATDPVAAIAETLAPFRGTGELVEAMLMRGGRALALAALALDAQAELVDLDDPAVLLDAALRPSHVATRVRAVTQAQALRLHDERPDAAGLRWWSTLESSWINVTLFDRAAGLLAAERVEPLTLGDARVRRAAASLGLG
ncbi:MAG TPA: RES family NAD+ phosphorylase [Conexibacter sp.]|nr:RES family NAD+ phosphorylase [Conexibacter sp.]